MTPAQRASLVALVQWAAGCDDVQWENEPNNFNADPSVTLGIVTTRREGLPERRFSTDAVTYHAAEVATIDGQVQVTSGGPCDAAEVANLAAIRLACGADRPQIAAALALGVDVRFAATVSTVRNLATNWAVIDAAVLSMEVAFLVSDVDTDPDSLWTIEKVEGLQGTLTREDGSTTITTDNTPP